VSSAAKPASALNSQIETADRPPRAIEGAGASRPEPLPLPEGTTVLHVGDSFASALGIALNRELKRAKIHGVLHYKTSSFIPTWAYGKDVPKYLRESRPDLVLISLGANELATPQLEQRAVMVRRLVGMLGGRPCVWIAPPLWHGKNVSDALLTVIRDNCAPCRYMDSNVLVPELPRVKDGVHPAIEARDDWARLVLRWLAEERQPTPAYPWALRAP